ncbi:MAG TPA: hypothetical protein VNL16_20010 [Chloroflexota bacterium]|nr:hypothetical protein [Chloroflexota bacterium]
MDKGTGLVPSEVETAIKDIAGNPNRAEAAFILASIANAATARLHQLVRSEANARKGTPDWGRWASLTNASRDAILRTATCRQTANQLYQATKENAPAAKSALTPDA